MGRWSGLSSFIDFHFDHGEPSFRQSLLTTRYHKLDDSIFVLCRNCGQSLKTDESKKMSPNAGGPRLRQNPKHFLTWSATAANSRLQKMSKHFVTNISKLHMKVEKAIPFQQGIATTATEQQQVCSPGCESVGGNAKSGNGGGAADHNYTSKNLNDHENNNTVTPDVVQTNNHGSVSKDGRLFAPPNVIRTVRNSASGLPVDVANNGSGKMIQQNVDIGNVQQYHHHGRVQSARIVQSHPSISLSHSTTNGTNGNGVVGGSVANPDKIVQFSIDTFNKYAPKELNTSREVVVIEKPQQGVVKYHGRGKEDDHGSSRDDDDDEEENEGSRMELCYDSGTGSANVSLSDSSLSSVATLPLTSPSWSRTNSVSVIKDSNLEGTSSTSILHQSQTNCLQANEKSKNPNETTSPVKSHGKSVTFALGLNGKNASQDSSNLTNAGVGHCSESTDDKSLLIDNKKSINKKGGRKNSSNSNSRNVEICNNKNLVVPSPDQKLESNSSLDKIQTLISPIYPPSKLAVTIFEEEAELRHTPWFQAGIPREIALEVLRNEPIGSFIVRESTTKSGCFALSLRVPKDHQPGGIAHYLIFKTSRGYKIKGFTKEFGSLSSLITHHSVMPELLPCPLSLHRYRPKFPLRVSRANSSDFMEPDKFIIRSFTDF